MMPGGDVMGQWVFRPLRADAEGYAPSATAIRASFVSIIPLRTLTR